MRPPHGICLPCSWVDYRHHSNSRRRPDGDTVHVVVGALLLKIRLDSIDPPPLNTPQGLAAWHFVESVLEEAADDLSVWITIPRNSSITSEPFDLLKYLSFGRIPGEIYIGEEKKLTDIIVNAGHAVRV